MFLGWAIPTDQFFFLISIDVAQIYMLGIFYYYSMSLYGLSFIPENRCQGIMLVYHNQITEADGDTTQTQRKTKSRVILAPRGKY